MLRRCKSNHMFILSSFINEFLFSRICTYTFVNFKSVHTVQELNNEAVYMVEAKNKTKP